MRLPANTMGNMIQSRDTHCFQRTQDRLFLGCISGTNTWLKNRKRRNAAGHPIEVTKINPTHPSHYETESVFNRSNSSRAIASYCPCPGDLYRRQQRRVEY